MALDGPSLDAAVESLAGRDRPAHLRGARRYCRHRRCPCSPYRAPSAGPASSASPPRAGRESPPPRGADLADRHAESGRPPLERGVVRDRQVRLRHADGQVAEAPRRCTAISSWPRARNRRRRRRRSCRDRLDLLGSARRGRSEAGARRLSPRRRPRAPAPRRRAAPALGLEDLDPPAPAARRRRPRDLPAVSPGKRLMATTAGNPARAGDPDHPRRGSAPLLHRPDAPPVSPGSGRPVTTR